MFISRHKHIIFLYVLIILGGGGLSITLYDQVEKNRVHSELNRYRVILYTTGVLHGALRIEHENKRISLEQHLHCNLQHKYKVIKRDLIELDTFKSYIYQRDIDTLIRVFEAKTRGIDKFWKMYGKYDCKSAGFSE